MDSDSEAARPTCIELRKSIIDKLPILAGPSDFQFLVSHCSTRAGLSKTVTMPVSGQKAGGRALLTSYYRHIDLANASLHELEKLSHFCRHYEYSLESNKKFKNQDP